MRTAPARRLAGVTGALVMLAALAVALPPSASAHGTTISPMTRNYSCWKRWGSRFQDPVMQTQDPMCWQAWQADTSAMWNWNGLLRDGVGGKFTTAVPDGQLCSGGRTVDGRYTALEKPGAWKTTALGNSFTWTFHDQALHGADFFRIYVTKQGYDARVKPLAWDDLELIKDTGKVLPSSGIRESDTVLNGVTYRFPVRAPGRTGRHIVFTLWQASHSDQSYFLCSDVTFPSGSDRVAPTTPGTPSVTKQTATSVTLTWPASTDAVGVKQYQIVRRRFGQDEPLGTSTTNTFTVTGMTPGQTYRIAVYAVDAALNRSPRSAPVVVTVPKAAGAPL